MANNYIVNAVLGESAPSNPAILLSRNSATRPGTWNSGGYNISGTAWYCTTWATPRDRTQTPDGLFSSVIFLVRKCLASRLKKTEDCIGWKYFR